MKTRPLSITIVAWCLVLSSLAFAIALLMAFILFQQDGLVKSPESVLARVSFILTKLAIMFVSGIAILKGINWGRWLYIIIALLSFSAKSLLVLTILISFIALYFLFNQSANQYFQPKESSDTQVS